MESTIFFDDLNRYSKTTEKLILILQLAGILIFSWYCFEGNTIFIFDVFWMLVIVFNRHVLENPIFDFSPRIVIEDGKLEMRQHLLRKKVVLSLSRLKEIKLGSYQFTLYFEDGKKKRLAYTSSSSKSIKIKKALRKLAQVRNVPIHY